MFLRHSALPVRRGVCSRRSASHYSRHGGPVRTFVRRSTTVGVGQLPARQARQSSADFRQNTPGENPMPRLLSLMCAAAVWLIPAASVLAEDYPSRPVRIIIPLGPGGGGDVFTRLMAEELHKRLGQPFIVENRPGGGLNIGTRACAEALPTVIPSASCPANRWSTTSSPSRTCRSTRKRISSRSSTCSSTPTRWWRIRR